jgi:asparagine synthase (glutamine-hydrolysing)
MAHGLETRLPFLDNDLVDFAQRIPVALKLRGLDPADVHDQ